ncbi:hypothetical protein LIA77_01494 [Sarocladium implicatum]|nr:hypothetical protein LIA77_01494 [Sarocladium implicatum]
MWAFSRTGLAQHVHIATLHLALITKRCVICGSFGGFIFLPAATRCCFHCIVWSPKLQVASLHSVYKISSISTPRLKRFHPVVSSHPGTYTSARTEENRRRFLISKQHILELFRKTEMENASELLARLPNSELWRCMASASLPYLDATTGQTEVGVSCKGCQIAMEADMTELNATRRDCLCSHQDFLEHFRHCKEARELWISSKTGARAVKEPEFTRLGGYF